MYADAEVQVGRPSRWLGRASLGIAATSLVAAIWLLVGLGIRAEFQRAANTATEATATLARSLESEVAGRLRNIETILRYGGALHARAPDALAVPDWIAIDPAADIIGAALIGPDGMVRSTLDGVPPAPIDLRDRPHIAAILADPTRDRLEIGAPLTSRATGRQSIDIARPLRDDAGGFAGIIMVTVDSTSFARLYRRPDLQDGVVGLIGLDGVVRARAPGEAALPGAPEGASLLGATVSDESLAAIRAGAAETSMRRVSALDGVERFLTLRRVAGQPLVVSVGTSVEAALAHPREERRALLAIGGFLTLSIAAICLTVAQVRRRERRSRAQLEAVVAHVGQGIMMIDPARRLAVVNQRVTELLGLPPGLAVPGRTIDAIVAWQEQAGEFGGGPAPHSHIDSLGGPGSPPFITLRTRPDGTILEIRTAYATDGSHVRSFTDVTDARRSAAAIAAARDRALAAEAALVAALENVPHGVMLVGADNRVQIINRTAIELTGMPAEAARPGAHVADLLQLQVELGEFAAGSPQVAGSRAAIEDRSAPMPTYLRTNRRGQDMEVRTTFLADGRFIRTYTDVTLHHAALRAEAVLRDQAVAAQAALAAAFENVPHGVLLTGADRRVQVINAIAAELIELPPELARPGAALRDILAFQLERGDFAGNPAVSAAARASLDAAEPPLPDYERRLRDGRVVDVRTTRLADGRIIRTFTDVTARHLALQAEAAARDQAEAAQAALAAAFENAPLGISLVGADGRIEVINSLAVALLDLPPELARPGTDSHAILRAQLERGDFAALPDAARQAAASLLPGAGEHPPYIRPLPDGRTLEVRVRFLADGRSVRTFTDVTARQAALRAQQTARLAAEAALRSRTEFLAVVSHELRTPLNAVIGLSEVLLLHQPRPDQVADLEMVRESGLQLLGLVDDILDVTRLERGRVTLREAAFDPRETIGAMAGLIAPRAAAKGLEFALELDPALPAAALGDQERLRQVLLKLLDNAVKFTGSGRVTLAAAPLAATAGGWRLGITITDTGIGITPEAEARLFEPFAQADSSTARQFGGLGLGLTVCRLLLESMGGGIAVESAAGAGSTFRVELPLRHATPALLAPPGPTTPGPPLPGPTPPGSTTLGPAMLGSSLPVAPLRVLVVEDIAANRAVALALLRQLGHAAEAVEDGAAAVAALRAQSCGLQSGDIQSGDPQSGDIQSGDLRPYDLVLMDLMMPGMDGILATRAIRALPDAAGRVPIIAVAVLDSPAIRQQCREAGIDGFEGKPLETERLRRAIAAVMAARAA